MVFTLEFGFLGPEHSYVVSMARIILPDRVPMAAAETAFFRVPETHKGCFTRLESMHFTYNIRGHDCISYMGRATSMSKVRGPLGASEHIFGETIELRKFAAIPDTSLVSFGPSPGSFFADAPELKSCRWANLPPELAELEATLQKLLCRNGYGDESTKIINVSMNSAGGWVVQGGKDNGVFWGPKGDFRKFPRELEDILKTLGKNKPHIQSLVMNHQHPTEYVLVLSDGTVHCKLHQEFEIPFRNLLEKEIKGRKERKGKKSGFRLNFVPSCECITEDQRLIDAAYYYRRGLFQLQKKNVELAYEYLKEAHTQYGFDTKINKAYATSLRALRHQREDRILEIYLARGDRSHPPPSGTDTNFEFRHQYYGMLTTIESLGEDELVLDRSQREWSWVAELEEMQVKVTGHAEVDGRVRRVELDLSPVSAVAPETILPENVAELPATLPDYITCQYKDSNIFATKTSDGSTSYYSRSTYA